MTSEESLEMAALEAASGLGIECDLIRHDESGASTSDAVNALGEDPANILKCLILCDKKTGKTVAAIIRGDTKLDIKAVQRLSTLEKLSFATPEFIHEMTGFEIGGVPPVAAALCDVIIVDSNVLLREYVIGAGGHPHCGMKMSPLEFMKIPNIRVEVVSK